MLLFRKWSFEIISDVKKRQQMRILFGLLPSLREEQCCLHGIFNLIFTSDGRTEII